MKVMRYMHLLHSKSPWFGEKVDYFSKTAPLPIKDLEKI